MIFKRIDDMMKKKNHKQKELDTYLGLARGTYTNWVRNKSRSFMLYLKEIAEFLEVTPNYLVSGREFPISHAARVSLHFCSQKVQAVKRDNPLLSRGWSFFSCTFASKMPRPRSIIIA